MTSLSLRWRYAPACGNSVWSSRSAYPALIPQRVFLRKPRWGNGTGFRFSQAGLKPCPTSLCRAFGA